MINFTKTLALCYNSKLTTKRHKFTQTHRKRTSCMHARKLNVTLLRALFIIIIMLIIFLLKPYPHFSSKRPFHFFPTCLLAYYHLLPLPNVIFFLCFSLSLSTSAFWIEDDRHHNIKSSSCLFFYLKTLYLFILSAFAVKNMHSFVLLLACL